MYIHFMYLYIISERIEFGTILKFAFIDMGKGIQGEEAMPL